MSFVQVATRIDIISLPHCTSVRFQSWRVNRASFAGYGIFFELHQKITEYDLNKIYSFQFEITIEVNERAFGGILVLYFNFFIYLIKRFRECFVNWSSIFHSSSHPLFQRAIYQNDLNHLPLITLRHVVNPRRIYRQSIKGISLRLHINHEFTAVTWNMLASAQIVKSNVSLSRIANELKLQSGITV